MSIIAPIPLNKLGAIYRPWTNAPAGALIAFGGNCRHGGGQNYTDLQRQLVALRADGEGDLKVMMALAPEPFLIMEAPRQGAFRSFESTFAFTEPAVDISARYELTANNLAPHDAGELELGDLVGSDRDELLVFAGRTSRDRFIHLDGTASWTLTDIPDGHLRYIGRLGVAPKSI